MALDLGDGLLVGIFDGLAFLVAIFGRLDKLDRGMGMRIEN